MTGVLIKLPSAQFVPLISAKIYPMIRWAGYPKRY